MVWNRLLLHFSSIGLSPTIMYLPLVTEGQMFRADPFNPKVFLSSKYFFWLEFFSQLKTIMQVKALQYNKTMIIKLSIKLTLPNNHACYGI